MVSQRRQGFGFRLLEELETLARQPKDHPPRARHQRRSGGGTPTLRALRIRGGPPRSTPSPTRSTGSSRASKDESGRCAAVGQCASVWTLWEGALLCGYDTAACRRQSGPQEGGSPPLCRLEASDAVPDDQDVRQLHWLSHPIGADLVDTIAVTAGRCAYRRPDGIGVVPPAMLGILMTIHARASHGAERPRRDVIDHRLPFAATSDTACVLHGSEAATGEVAASLVQSGRIVPGLRVEADGRARSWWWPLPAASQRGLVATLVADPSPEAQRFAAERLADEVDEQVRARLIANGASIVSRRPERPTVPEAWARALVSADPWLPQALDAKRVAALAAAVQAWVRSGAFIGGRARLCLRVHEPEPVRRRAEQPWLWRSPPRTATSPACCCRSRSCGRGPPVSLQAPSRRSWSCSRPHGSPGAWSWPVPGSRPNRPTSRSTTGRWRFSAGGSGLLPSRTPGSASCSLVVVPPRHPGAASVGYQVSRSDRIGGGCRAGHGHDRRFRVASGSGPGNASPRRTWRPWPEPPTPNGRWFGCEASGWRSRL